MYFMKVLSYCLSVYLNQGVKTTCLINNNYNIGQYILCIFEYY